jgi:GAF domain-containing protein
MPRALALIVRAPRKQASNHKRRLSGEPDLAAADDRYDRRRRHILCAFTDKQISLFRDFAAQATIALESTRRERQYREMQSELAHVVSGQRRAHHLQVASQPAKSRWIAHQRAD